MTALYKALRILVVVAGFAAVLYALYVRWSVPNPLIPQFIPAGVVIAIAVAALASLILPAEARAPKPAGREITGAPAEPSHAFSLLGFLVATLAFVAMLFLGYMRFATSPVTVIGMDHIGALLPYGVSAIMALIGIGDSLFGRVVTGTATGKSPMGQRLLLIGKRLGVTTLIVGIVALLHIQVLDLYTDPRSQMAVTIGFALLFSIVLIPRTPAFTRSRDGDAGRII